MNNIKKLSEIYGINWAVKYMIPKLLALHLESNYLHRLTPLFGIAVLSSAVNPDIAKRHFLPVL